MYKEKLVALFIVHLIKEEQFFKQMPDVMFSGARLYIEKNYPNDKQMQERLWSEFNKRYNP
jgi:hypothetical protein